MVACVDTLSAQTRRRNTSEIPIPIAIYDGGNEGRNVKRSPTTRCGQTKRLQEGGGGGYKCSLGGDEV